MTKYDLSPSNFIPAPNMIYTALGRGLHKNVHKDFDRLSKEYTLFITVEQNAKVPKDWAQLWEFLRAGKLSYNSMKVPELRTGEMLFGLNRDGSFTKLGEIIDSGD